jgi:hypothetical protein
MSNMMKRISGRFNRADIDQSFKTNFNASTKDSLPPEQKAKADGLDKAVKIRGLLSAGKKNVDALAHQSSHTIDSDAKAINSMATKERFKQALPEGLKTPKKTQLIQSSTVEAAKTEIGKIQKEMGALATDEGKLAKLEADLQNTSDPAEINKLSAEIDSLHNHIENKIEVLKTRMNNVEGTFKGMRSNMTASVARFSMANPKNKKLLESKNETEKKFNKEVSDSVKEFKQILTENHYVQDPFNYEEAISYMATRAAYKDLDLPEGSSPLVKQFSSEATELKQTITGFRDLMKDIDPKASLSADQIKDLKTEGGRKRMAADLANTYLYENRLPPKPAGGSSQAFQLVLQNMGEKVIAHPNKSTFIISGSTTPILVGHIPGKENVTFAFKFRIEDGFNGRQDASKFSYMEHLGYAHPLSNVGSALVSIDPSNLPKTTFTPQEGEDSHSYNDFVQENGVKNEAGQCEFLVEEFVPNDGTAQKYTLTLALAFGAVEEGQKQIGNKGPERMLAVFGNADEKQLSQYVNNMTINPKDMGSLKAHLKSEGDGNNFSRLAVTVNDTVTQNQMLSSLNLNELSPEEKNHLAKAMGIDLSKVAPTISETITNYEKELKTADKEKKLGTEINKLRDTARQNGLAALKETILQKHGTLSNEQKLGLAQYIQENDRAEYKTEMGLSDEQFEKLKLTPEEQKTLEGHIAQRHESIAAGNTSKPELAKQNSEATDPIHNRITDSIMELKHSKSLAMSAELGFDHTNKDFLQQSFFTDNSKKSAAESWTIRYLNDDLRNQDDNIGGLLLKKNEDGTFALHSIDFEESRPRMVLAGAEYTPGVEASRALVAHENAPRLPTETKNHLLEVYSSPKKMIEDLKSEVKHINPQLSAKKEIHPDGYEMDQLVNYDFERAGKHAIRAHLLSEPAHDDTGYDKWAQINVRSAVIDKFEGFWVNNKMASMTPEDKEKAWTKFEAELTDSFRT